MNGSSPAASQEDQILIAVQELMAANPGMTQDEAIQQVLGSMPDSEFRQPKPPAPPEELDGGLAGAPAGDIPLDPGLMGKNEHVTVGPNGNPLLSDGKEGYGHFFDNSLDAGLARALEKQYAEEAAADLKMQDRMAVEKDVSNRQRDEAESLGMIEPRTYDNLVEQDPTVTGGFRQEEVQIPSPTPDDPDRTTPVTRVTGGEQQFHGQGSRELAESKKFGYQYIQLDPMTGQPVLDEKGQPIPIDGELAKKQQIESVAAYDFVPVLTRDGEITYINPTLMANRPETDESMGEMSPSELRSLRTQQNRIRDRMGVSDEDATFTPYRRRDGSIGNRIDPNSKAVRGKRQAAVDEEKRRRNLVTMRAMMSPRDRGGNFVVPQSQINAQALLMGADMPAAMPQLSDMDDETRRGLLYQTFPNLAKVDVAEGEQVMDALLARLRAARGFLGEQSPLEDLQRKQAEKDLQQQHVAKAHEIIGDNYAYKKTDLFYGGGFTADEQEEAAEALAIEEDITIEEAREIVQSLVGQYKSPPAPPAEGSTPPPNRGHGTRGRGT